MESRNTNCIICEHNKNSNESTMDFIWSSPSWFIRHDMEPSPIPGWLTLQPSRCIQGVSKLTDQEAVEFGIISRNLALGIQISLDVPKTYSISFSESVAHLHTHFIPRYTETPSRYVSFGVSDLFREVKSGSKKPAEKKKITSAISSLRSYFSANPPL